MRNKRFTVGLLALFPLAVVGCQSTSQLAWWKSAKNSELEATAIAHSAAPQLPSEAAKQAEKLAATGAAGSETIPTSPAVPGTSNASAANMVATMTPPSAAQAAYPTTGATGYSGSTVVSVPASYPTTQVPTTPSVASQVGPSAASRVGTMAMPYDPGAVPPRSTSEAPVVAATSPATQADRYAASTLASSNPQATVRTPGTPAYQSGTPAYQATGSRYGNSVASSTGTMGSGSKPGVESIPATNPPTAMAPAYAQVAPVSAPQQNMVPDAGNSYPTTNQHYVTTNQPGYVSPASSSAPTTGTLPAANSVAGLPYPMTTGGTSSETGTTSGETGHSNPGTHSPLDTSMVANGHYRPGGTSNYPGTSVFPSPVQVASRPGGTVSAGLPEDNAIQSQQPQTQSVTEPASVRYR